MNVLRIFVFSILALIILFPTHRFVYAKDSNDIGFAGKWDTNFGVVTIQITGYRVSGTFYDGNGSIEGTVNGYVIEGNWIQPDRSGKFRFEMGLNGNTFKGRWTEEDNSGGGEWNGKSLDNVQSEMHPENSKNGFSGHWETDYGILIIQVSENRAIGIYYEGTASIKGKVKGYVLEGNWSQPDRNGKFRFELGQDGTTFKGRWSDANNTGGGEWNGRRKQ